MSQESINPDPSCEDDYDPHSMPVDEALRRIKAAIKPLQVSESVAVRAALGRVLSVPVTAPFDVPPHRNSARDGIALRSSDLREALTRLRLVGASFAGHPYPHTLAAGEAIRIMTGAAMPAGADSVAMQEHVDVDGGYVDVPKAAARTTHIRHPGEDMRAGASVMPAGQWLRPADLGVLASLGIAEVPVYRRLRTAYFSTGDELRSVGQTLAPGDIFDSNRYTVHGMLARLGVEGLDLGIVRDTADEVRRAFEQACAAADVVISTGGVSVGAADYVTGMLRQMGTVNFWKIAMKPGRPLTFGHVNGALFFGLPGNPVSVMVTFYQFVQPALRLAMGIKGGEPPLMRVPLAASISKQPGRVEYQRGILTAANDGSLEVSSTGAQGSHILHSMSTANCFIVLPLESEGAEAGERVSVQPFEGLI
ncbi:MAG: molybdopterin molybdenumtransferase MoeA [Gammaproteobacteria bacterium]|nr:molybdopterin molybdenumtransferase MoeA [Gammaproteobacteria bacterium]